MNSNEKATDPSKARKYCVSCRPTKMERKRTIESKMRTNKTRTQIAAITAIKAITMITARQKM